MLTLPKAKNRLKSLNPRGVVAVLLATAILLCQLPLSPTRPAHAAVGVPKLLNFQGRLTDASDNLEDGTFYFCFWIYDAESAGNKVWPAGNPTPQAVTVSNGVFSTHVGASPNTLDATFNADSYWLAVDVDPDNDADCTTGGDLLTPRQRVTATGYAINSDTVDGIHAATTATASQLLALDADKDLELGTGDVSATLGTFSSTLSAPTLTLTGTGTINGLDVIDATTETTLESYIDIAGDVSGTGLASVSVDKIKGAALGTTTATDAHLLIADGTDWDSVAMSGDIAITNAGLTAIQANAVVLATDTSGNFVATITGGSGISSTGATTGENINHTLSLGALTADWTQSGAFDIKLANASAELKIMESVGDTYYGILDVTDLGADRTYTFPDKSGTVAMLSDAGSKWTDGGTYIYPTDAGNYGSSGLQITDAGGLSLDENLIVDGNVGIGTTAPAAQLDIVGSNLYISEGSSETATDTFVIRHYPIYESTPGRTTTSAIAFLKTSTANNTYDGEIQFRTRTTGAGMIDAMRIDKGGNVGIGTTGPSSKLDIETFSDNSAVDPYDYTGGVEIQGNAAAGAVGGYSQIWMKSWATDGVILRSFANANNDIDFRVGFTTSNAFQGDKFTIEHTGNVGIGTTAPGATLHVAHPSVTAASLTWGASAGTILRSENSELAMGLLNASPWYYWMQARTNTSTSRDIVINPLGGSVGIGTAGPSGTFDVDGSLYVGNEGIYDRDDSMVNIKESLAVDGSYIWLEGAKNTYAGIETRYSDRINDRYGLAQATGGNTALYTSSYYAPSFISFNLANAGGTFDELVRITHAGNVGIGTTAPGSYKLNVQGYEYIQQGKWFECASCGSTSTLFGSSNWGDLTIQGRVFSGSSNIHLSPPAGLKVVIDDTYRAAGGASGGLAGLSVEGDTWLATDGGNVGIGDTSPDEKLTVRGHIAISRGYKIAWSATGTSGTGEYIHSKVGSPYDVCIHSGSYDALCAPNNGNLYLVQSAGNVGIGTTSPIAKLEVKAASAEININASSSDPQLSFSENGTARYQWWYSTGNNYLELYNFPRTTWAMRVDDDTGDFHFNGAAKYGFGRDGWLAQRLDVNGFVRCDGLDEYSTEFIGDALDVFRNIKTREIESETGEGWRPVSHLSLPPEVVREWVEPGTCAEARANDEYPEDAECVDLGNNQRKIYGRSLNDMVSLNRRGLQQLGVIMDWGNTPFISKDGYIGIGTADPTHDLDLGNGTYVDSGGAWHETSDVRFKTEVSDLAYGLEDILKLRPISYIHQNDETGTTQLGFIAQEVSNILPEVVGESGGYLSLSYGRFAPVLTRAIQEQQDQIATLSAQLDDLSLTNTGDNQTILSPLVQTDEIRFTSEDLRFTNSEGEDTMIIEEDGDVDILGVLTAKFAEITDTLKVKNLEVENLHVTGEDYKPEGLGNAGDEESVEDQPSPFGELLAEQTDGEESISENQPSISEDPEEADSHGSETSEEESPNSPGPGPFPSDPASPAGGLAGAEATISGSLTVQGRAHFLDHTVMGDTTVTGDLSQGGTLFITEGSKIDNLAGDLSLQQDSLVISKEGTVSAKKKLAIENEDFTAEELAEIAAYEATASAGFTDILSRIKHVFELRHTITETALAYLDNTGRFFARVLAGRRVETEVVSPLAGGELFIQLTDDENSRLAILNAQQEEVASIDAEGTGTFNKLAIRTTSAGETLRVEDPKPEGLGNAESIGSATITAGRLQALITTEAVTDQSKVFITPTSSTGGQIPYIAHNETGSRFIARIDQPLSTDLTFDWWVVN